MVRIQAVRPLHFQGRPGQLPESLASLTERMVDQLEPSDGRQATDRLQARFADLGALSRQWLQGLLPGVDLARTKVFAFINDAELFDGRTGQQLPCPQTTLNVAVALPDSYAHQQQNWVFKAVLLEYRNGLRQEPDVVDEANPLKYRVARLEGRTAMAPMILYRFSPAQPLPRPQLPMAEALLSDLLRVGMPVPLNVGF